MRRELERVEVPDAEAARERARDVVLAAYAEREVVPVRRRPLRLVAACAVLAVAAVAGAALSPPGEAVVDRIREVIGVERAQPALFRLPTGGRLLVASDAGVWVVEQDGKKRLLPGYREASWSPFGRFVVATKANELAALERDGDVRWTLARGNVRSPRWTGSESDTRIAYLDRSGIRIVAGDGTGDRGLSPEVAPIAWRPGAGYVLGQLQASELRLQDATTGRVISRARAGLATEVLGFSWAPNGERALVVHPWELTVVDPERNTSRPISFAAADVVGAAFSPTGTTIAVLRANELVLLDPAHPRVRTRVFAGEGPFQGVAWSPDGRWLLIGWPAADQWVFVRADGGSIRAVGNVSEQFRSRTFPRSDGWCC